MRKLKNSELSRISPSDYSNAQKYPITIVLDNIRSANNIGSVFRTSDAFLIEAIYLCGICCTPPNKDIYKTALGAESIVSWKYFNNTIDAIEDLRKSGNMIYAIEQVENSISLENFSVDNSKKYAFVFGNEVKGVEQEIVNVCDGSIEIPQFGTKHSLNISVSFGIVIWDIFCKFRSTKNRT